MKAYIKIVTILIALITVTGCSYERHEGPGERAGRHIDNAVEDTRDAAHDIKEDVKRDYHRHDRD